MAGRFVSYLRVSTDRQGRSGLGLEAQRTAVAGYVGGGRVVAELVEVESGRRSDRPQLADALALCRAHRATLVIAKLDRLARNVAFIATLMDSGVEFVAVDFPQANRLTIHILAAVAEHEREMISARTKAALQAAKARGVVLGGFRGRPGTALEAAQARAAKTEKAQARARALAPVIARLDPGGALSLHGLAKALNGEEVPTVSGIGAWTPAGVRRLRQHLAA
ncbi:recombinase family protein [Methylobacterium sp. E-065]|uniref:recombinase family protein n=1 Tax=Methylobacterium sp. E-065 TaxID=2836583 RepID=UPI001FBBCE5A|nr:recombinase family protein [Methylobacterium sp. E-065]MCJ2017158.1 recombinase family protein [Methylobacterium sp. E-065]